MSSVLDLPILKLSKTWMPVRSETVRDAMTQLVEDKACVLDPITYELYAFKDWIKQSVQDDELYVRTPNLMIKVPEIIILRDYADDPTRKRIVIYNRRNVWRRDNGYCSYCCQKVKPDDCEIDHVIPKSRGGKSCFENSALCCTACNRRKADRTPKEAGMPLKRMMRQRDGKLVAKVYDKPKRPRWTPAYNIKRAIPKSWEVFLKDLISDLYWDVELEE